MNSDLINIQHEVSRRRGSYDEVKRSATRAEEEVRNLGIKNEQIRSALEIIQTVATATQKQLEYHVSELVTLALSAVFPHPYKMALTFEMRRNRSEADLHFMRGEDRVDPMDGSGGGPVDVAAFALRVSLWNLSRPRSRAVIILDEPFRFLSRDLQPQASALMKELSDKLGIQFIYVTHEPHLLECADRIFQVSQTAGRSSVQMLSPAPQK